MTWFKGFETKEQAKKFIKDKGRGYLTFEEYTPKTKRLTTRGKEYMMAVEYGGLNKELFPYCVQWNETQM
jgi:hypothetical protein